jgi:predicted Zn-dependent peptidase
METGGALIVESLEAPTAAIGVWVRVGSAWEPEGQAGITHLLEHLLLRRCGSRTPEEIAELIDALGGQVDAFTTREVCAVTAHVPQELRQEALELVLDAVFDPRLEPGELEVEKGVVAAEFDVVQDSPAEVAAEKALAACWGRHPLARPILGYRETVAALGVEALRAFHRGCFGRDRALVVAVGPWEEAELAARWDRIPLAGRAQGVLPPPSFLPALVREERPGLEQVYVHLVFPGLPSADPELPALGVLDQLLGAGNASRLFRQLRDRLGLVYDVGSAVFATQWAGVLEVSFSAPASRAARAWGAVLEVLQDVASGGITPREVSIAKQALASGVVLGSMGPDALMEAHAGEFLSRGRRFSRKEVEAEIRQVELEQVQALAARVLRLDLLAGAVCGPPGQLGIPGELEAKVA